MDMPRLWGISIYESRLLRAFRIPAIAASIRTSLHRPMYSYCLAHLMSMRLCVPACSAYGRCLGLS